MVPPDIGERGGTAYVPNETAALKLQAAQPSQNVSSDAANDNQPTSTRQVIIQAPANNNITDTIDYVVTDSAGLTATSTRQDIIQAIAAAASTDASSTTAATSTTP